MTTVVCDYAVNVFLPLFCVCVRARQWLLLFHVQGMLYLGRSESKVVLLKVDCGRSVMNQNSDKVALFDLQHRSSQPCAMKNQESAEF